MDVAAVSDRLADRFSHPRWILLTDVTAHATATIEKLREWGAVEFLVIGTSEGVGDQPGEGVEVLLVPGPPVAVMEAFRRFTRLMADPPIEVRAAVERFDPDGTARALGPLFAAPEVFLGRSLYGSRPTDWEALEDKTVIDAIWDEAGVSRAPAEVVPVDGAPAAAGRLDTGHGTVWAADNAEGWHGGGEYTRWVPDPAGRVDAVEWFRGRAARVRVMPFLEGVPCSIHGVVVADGVAALRPVELLVLRRRDRQGFVYAGVATVWDAPRPLREEMRAAARRIGELLRDRTAHRGPFAVDGVATADGFRPTELNPRFSVGFASLAVAVDGLDLSFFVRALVEGDITVPATLLEEAIVGASESSRRCHVGVSVPTAVPAATIDLDPGDGGGELTVGPSPTGSFVRWSVDMGQVAIGPPFAPRVEHVLSVARTRWGLPIPEAVASGG